MTYAQLGNLRLSTIHQYSFKTDDFEPLDPLTHGIHLDKSDDNGRSWYAIAEIVYRKEEQDYSIQSVGDRLMKALSKDNLDNVKFLCSYALEFFKTLEKDRHKECDFYWSDEADETEEE